MVEASRDRRDASAIAAQDLLRGLRSSVDEVFATMLSTLGVHTKHGDPCLPEPPLENGAEGLEAITVEARVDIQGPLQGWISLSCTARAADSIARGMLVVGANDVLAKGEVEDALKECANMIAGLLKSDLLDARGAYTIGLPSLSTRKVARPRPQGALAYRLCAGTFQAELWLDRRPGPS
ncbi:MAG TPA: chemotaxis protein CheX [Planctomycetota bacterium]|nr:chemotaxis protein CheX [Planctomycetota bacterium]